jgi:hypothetical protein
MASTEGQMSPTTRIAKTRTTTRTSRNDTTRHLCAAAHLDPAFADDAIREFLTEPLRAIPPSPGIDAVAVLREAVAARKRRQLRDWTLLLLFVSLAICGVGLALGWLVLGVAMAAFGSSGRLRLLLGGVGLILLAGLALLVRIGLPGLFLGPVQVLPVLAALVVVVLDRFALSYLLTRSFRRGTFTPTPAVDSWPGERWVRTLAGENYDRELARVAQADDAGDVVAHLGHHPFVGAGQVTGPSSYAIPLGSGVFTLAALYDHVSAALAGLRDSPPSDRLSTLTERTQVIVSVEEMLADLADPETRTVLPDLGLPPNRTVPAGRLADLIEHPLAWMRYYRCYQVETGDITVTVHLHLTAGERTLYLEWIPCVLFPIDDRYRVVDTMPFEPLAPLRDGLVEWLRMPGTLLTRLNRTFSRIRPVPDRTLSAARYGARHSLRELAAGTAPHNYFQQADLARHLHVLGDRMARAVEDFLAHTDGE